MQKANVYKNGLLVGVLSKNDNEKYIFLYDSKYLSLTNKKQISINLPLQNEPFASKNLFAFFSNMLAEGITKDIQINRLRLDKNDEFSRLIKTTDADTIGSISIKEITQ